MIVEMVVAMMRLLDDGDYGDVGGDDDAEDIDTGNGMIQ